MSETHTKALARLRRAALGIVLASSLGLAGSLNALADSEMALKNVTCDAKKQILVQFATGLGALQPPRLLEMPAPNHQLFVDFTGVSLDDNNIPASDQLTKQLASQMPGVKAARVGVLPNALSPTVRLILDLDPELVIKPSVAALQDGLVVISFGDDYASSTNGANRTATGGEGSSAPASQSASNDPAAAYEEYYRKFLQQKQIIKTQVPEGDWGPRKGTVAEAQSVKHGIRIIGTPISSPALAAVPEVTPEASVPVVPIHDAPVQAAPVSAAQVEAAPAQAVPVSAAQVEAAPAQAAPVSAAPVEAAPAQAAPVQSAQVEAAPAQAAPVSAAQVEAAPAQAAPVSAAQVEAAPAQAAPVSAAQVEAAPAQAAPVSAAQVEATPAQAAVVKQATVEAAAPAKAVVAIKEAAPAKAIVSIKEAAPVSEDAVAAIAPATAAKTQIAETAIASKEEATGQMQPDMVADGDNSTSNAAPASTSAAVPEARPAAVPTPRHTITRAARSVATATPPPATPAVEASPAMTEGDSAASPADEAAASSGAAMRVSKEQDKPENQSHVSSPVESELPPAVETPRHKAGRLYNEAYNNHVHGHIAQAIIKYKEALKINPDLGDAHSNLGLAYNQQHNYASAMSEFHKALAINPRDAITYNGYGAALRAEQDMQGAIKNWETAVKIDPKLAVAHYNLGTAYEAEGDFDRALASYEEAVKNDQRLGEAYFRMGLIMQKRHRLQDARAHYKKALKISEDSDYAAEARAKIAAIDKLSTK